MTITFHLQIGESLLHVSIQQHYCDEVCCIDEI